MVFVRQDPSGRIGSCGRGRTCRDVGSGDPRRTHISTTQLAEAFLAPEGPVGSAVIRALDRRGYLAVASEQESNSVLNWARRGWLLTLDFFMWSRRTEFDDSGPDWETKRREATERLLRAGEPPACLRGSGHPLPQESVDQMLGESTSLGTVLESRRSVISFSARNVPARDVFATLWSGMTVVRHCRSADYNADAAQLFRSIGVAFDFFLVNYSLTGMEPGVYFYDPQFHSIELRRLGDFRSEMEAALIGQPSVRGASATLLFVADFPRYYWRYRHERALRNLYIEAGRLMQYVLLCATAVGLRTNVSPAVDDRAMLSIVNGSDRTQQVLYTCTVG